MGVFKCEYLQLLKKNEGEVIYYHLETKTFYKHCGDLQKGKYGYLVNLIGIPIALVVGKMIQPYWKMQVLYWPGLHFLPIVLGIIFLISGFIIGIYYIQKKIKIEITPVFLPPSNEEIVEKGISWLKVQQKIMIIFIVLTFGLGLVSYYSTNFLISVIFIVSCICVGILGASIQPVERQKMYQKFSDELKMKGKERR